MLLRTKDNEHPDPIGDFVLEVQRKIVGLEYLTRFNFGYVPNAHEAKEIFDNAKFDTGEAMREMIRAEFDRCFEKLPKDTAIMLKDDWTYEENV